MVGQTWNTAVDDSTTTSPERGWLTESHFQQNFEIYTYTFLLVLFG